MEMFTVFLQSQFFNDISNHTCGDDMIIFGLVMGLSLISTFVILIAMHSKQTVYFDRRLNKDRRLYTKIDILSERRINPERRVNMERRKKCDRRLILAL